MSDKTFRRLVTGIVVATTIFVIISMSVYFRLGVKIAQFDATRTIPAEQVPVLWSEYNELFD